MRLDNEMESRHVEDRRRYGTQRRSISLRQILFLWPAIRMLMRTKTGWAVMAVGIFVYFSGGSFWYSGSSDSKQAFENVADEKEALFIKKVLRNTERVWSHILSGYSPPTLVLYRGVTHSGCGYAHAQTGPFYCPADQKVYLDLSFFNKLAYRHNAPGDFAQAYVLAHEIGHHVQNIQGTLRKVHIMQQRAAELGREKLAKHLQIPVELQADCYAGVWAYHAKKNLEPGDIDEAIQAASQIGDDTLQKEAQGYVMPDSFTHGTSQQRMSWFLKGYESGKIKMCDTFGRI